VNKKIKLLLESAKKVKKNSYAPYSKFHVGAAVLSDKGNIYSGCNVENSSYGLTICAERNAIFNMVASGEKRIEKILINGETEDFLPPCGACRQVISEFADEDTEIILVNGKDEIKLIPFKEIMPFRFFLKGKGDSI